MAIDHVTLVTVSDEGFDIGNLLLSGIFDKTGRIQAGGDALCFEQAACATAGPWPLERRGQQTPNKNLRGIKRW